MSDPSLMKRIDATPQIPVQAAVDRPDLLASRPWLRYYEPGVPAQLLIPDRPLTWLLDRAANHFPGHPAFIYYGTKITYAQFSSMANRFAIALKKLGIQKGDRVAIALPNIPQYAIAFYGTLRAGAVAVPTNPLYTAREMEHQLTDSGARVLVVLDTFYPIIRGIRNKTALEHIIVTSPADFLPAMLRTLYPISQHNTKASETPLTEKELHTDASLHVMRLLLESHASKGAIELFNLPAPTHSSDLAVLQYTGGTTGLSKGAMLTHHNLLANTMQTRYWTPSVREGKEVTLCVSPFFHAYGMTVGMNFSILAGATMVLLPRFQSKDVLESIRRYHPTCFPGIPTMYIALLREAGKHTENLDSIKYCISGAAALPAKVQTDFETITHGKLVEGYGLSEAGPVTHCNPLTEDRLNGSIGLPFPNVEAAIRDQATGKLLPTGEIGELLVRGPNIMQGYWQREQETQDIFVNGWMRTGDIARMDEKGYFYIVDRSKDMINASGFNVYPREVEEVLFQHPAVEEAAVIGAPDPYRGETVTAFVVLKPGFKASEQTKTEIIEFCKRQLTSYKVPKKLEFREHLPKTLIGKVSRRELREIPPSA